MLIGISAIARARALRAEENALRKASASTKNFQRELIPKHVRSEGKSESSPEDSSANESSLNSTSIADAETSATPQIASIPPASHAAIDTIEQVDESTLGELGERDEITDEGHDARSRVLLLVGIPEQPLPGPFWRQYTARDADEALWQLEQVSCDVIIVDFYVDAASILRKVAKAYPHIPRLVRCNAERATSIRRQVPDAQDVMPSRCSEKEFFQILTRATAIDLGELTVRMEQHLGPVSTLPALPDNYQRIREIINDPDGKIRDIGRIVLRDIGLTTRVLQVVNSPLYGLRSPITDVVHAATLLGMRGIRDLALTVEVFGFFSAKIPMGGMTVESLYEFSVKVASLAQRIGHKHADDAYTAALLHQIGRLILMTRLPDAYQDALDENERNGGALRDAQRKAIGIDQDETSAYLLSVWGLPQRVIEAVAFYDAPSLVPHNTVDVVDILHIAVALVSEHHGDSRLELDETHLEMLGISTFIDEWRELTLEICPPPTTDEDEDEEDEDGDSTED